MGEADLPTQLAALEVLPELTCQLSKQVAAGLQSIEKGESIFQK